MRILLTRGTLHPGVEIKAEATNLGRLQGVVGVEPPRQHQLGFIEMGQHAPVERLTGTAALAAHFCIQQQAIRRVVEGGQRLAACDSDGLPDLAACRQQRTQRLDIGGILIAMELHRGEPQRLHRLGDGGGLGIAKYPHVRERCTRHHSAGGGDVYVARAFRHKDKAAKHGACLMGGDGVLGAGEAAHLVLAQHQLAYRRLQILLGHQGGAHQKALGVVAQLSHLGAVVDAGLADHHPIPRDLGRQLFGAGEIDAQIPQIPVVDANHRRAEGDGAGQLLLVAHLGQHAKAELLGHRE